MDSKKSDTGYLTRFKTPFFISIDKLKFKKNNLPISRSHHALEL